jgi:[ribosomal protein S5]-alanine N-acetyltransferase
MNQLTIIHETDRLYLCVFDDSQIDPAKEFWGDEEVMKLCNGATPHHFLSQVINGYRKCHEANGLSVYAVKDKETNEIIGASGFNITGSFDDIELIYHFSKKSWGKGFASEAAKGCLEYAKVHGKVHCITASVDPQNKGSVKILEKIGFTYKSTEWLEDTKQEELCYEYII